MALLPPRVIQHGRHVAVGVATFVLAWYLFADTLRHYAVIPNDSATDGLLRFRHFGGYEEYLLWRDVIADFQRACPGIVVRQEYSTATQSLYHAKLRQELLAGTAPDVSVVQLGPFAELASHFEALVPASRNGAAESAGLTPPLTLSERLFGELDPQALRAFQAGGMQRGLPIAGGTLLIYCNPDCFARAARSHGRPVELPTDDWDMNTFRSLAEDLTLDADQDGAIAQFGFFHPRWVYALPLVWSFGADIVDPINGQWLLTGESAEAAITFYKELLTRRRVCPREEELPLLAQDIAFLTGRTAMCINGPWFQQFLERTRLADRYRVVPIPHGPDGRWTRVTWDGVVVAGGLGDSRRFAANAFIAFLLSSSVQDRIATSGRALPARRASLGTFATGSPPQCRTPFVDSLGWARLEPVTPFYIQLDGVITRQMQRFLDRDDGRTAREFLDDLRRDPVIVEHFGEGLAP